MSEYDAGSGHESQGLSEAHQDYSGDNDGHQSLEAAGSSHQIEFDEHLVHVHHVEYDDAQGNHFEETELQIIDVHHVEIDDAFGNHFEHLDMREADFRHVESFDAATHTTTEATFEGVFHEDLDTMLRGDGYQHGLDQTLAPGGREDGYGGLGEV